MTERHQLWQALDRLQMDNRAQAARIVEIRSMVASLDLPADWAPARPGSPTALHPDACPECEIVGTHTADCSIGGYPRRPDATDRAAR